MRLLAALLLSAGLSAAGAVQAATPSDCPTPTGIAEPLHCGDAELATVEAQVNLALTAAEAKVSGAGRARLRDDQAAWHGYLAALCLGDAQPEDSSRVECLKQEYDRRRAELGRAVEITGNVTLLRYERFDNHQPQNAAEPARPVLTEIAWPQLDRATSRTQRRWNELMAKTAEQLAVPLDRATPDTDVLVDYRIESVTPELIQAVFSREFYIHGAEHGDDVTVSSVFLLPPARLLVAEDVFDPVKPWRSALAALAFRRLADAAQDEAWQLWPRDADALTDLVAEPTRWRLGKDGLMLHFDAYDVAAYASGEHDLLIPWPALNPYLKPNPVLHLPPPG